jgi:hypothetical protein
MTLQLPTESESHEQLHALYQALLFNQDCFDEFKRLLVLYEADTEEQEEEPAEAAAVRERLNDRIRGWIGSAFEALNPTQVLQWRAIIVEERFTTASSPWRASNAY